MTDRDEERVIAVPISTMQTVTYDGQPWERRKRSNIRIRKCPTIRVKCEEVETDMLVDTGCTTTVIAEEFYDELIAKGKKIMCLPMNRAYVIGATQKKSSPITKQVMLNVEIGSQLYEVVALVVKKLAYPIILGTDFMAELRAIIDLDRGVVELGSQRIDIDMDPEEETSEACVGKIQEETVEQKLEPRAEESKNIPPPKTVKQVRRLRGSCNSHGKFCPNFKHSMYLFYQLLKKGRKWKWDDSYQEAVDEIKKRFYKSCCIKHPNSKSLHTRIFFLGVKILQKKS